MFNQDIEEDPEFRQQIDLFRNDEVLNEIEKKLKDMKIEESKVSVNPKSKKKMTEEEIQKKQQELQKRKRNEIVFKESLKVVGEKDDDGWESVEEDYPFIAVD